MSITRNILTTALFMFSLITVIVMFSVSGHHGHAWLIGRGFAMALVLIALDARYQIKQKEE